ncbi:hypothetical protein [Falsarthrobacter nasiphocae]|uniref:Phytoene dehydrogenase-like protein n=1 Tax=Falsarthrobacter nasiphocae TaxID=189863 RepID=A0AAE3YGV3_9MICC|nr:hypothetical protein [Falsarthrobacter nasiphocae]MDR6892032.1 phytoene dehydrogenase-like protein [Falsarthrobacter nasiphocae]
MLPPHTPLALGTAALLGGTGLLAGWPIPRGGSQAIVDFLVRTLESLGGTIECNRRVDPGALPPEILSADLVLWDTDATTAHLAARPDTPAPPRRYGPGAAKADFVTNAPIPWSDPAMRQAGTVHLGGTWSDVSAAERAINSGRPAEHPVVLVSQPSLFDSSRAPAGLHTVWAYAHVPFGSRENPAEIITREIERFAPGFSATVLDVRTTTAEQLSEYNLNYVGGDIATGATRGLQMLTGGSLRKARAGESTGAASLGPAGGPGLDRGLRKSWRSVLSSSTRLRLPVHSLLSWPARFAASPWTLPRPGWYLCSAATPPGPGVHGMAGYIAARLALQTMDQPAPSSLRRAYQAMTPCP